MDLPKVPVNFVLAVMKETASRQEVLDAYASAPIDGQIPPKEFHVILWHNAYLRHKYGNQPDPLRVMQIPMRKLANKMYSGTEDPRLRADLLKRRFVCEDDGVNYIK